MNTVIEFKDVVLGYHGKPVLKGLSFSVGAGEYFGLVGPNGAGKTTILRAILGTLRPISGEVVVRGADGALPRFGYVPQRDRIDSVLPYTVEEVVTMGRYRQIGFIRGPRPDDRTAVAMSLRHVGMEELQHTPFTDLSGGQKQRVLIARALASDPEILILDEPTNGMDLSSRSAMLELIETLHRDDRLTVIMVSHLLDDVANHVRRIAIVERDFFQVGDVEEVLTGRNLSSLYNMDVSVSTLDGRKVILTKERHGDL